MIQMLPPILTDMIAAGEVVERPASCVKELLENSLDAGAEAITLEIRGGGSGLIRVTDNGEGMTPEDAILAFERHATSKLISIDGLFDIRTFGFRGEALAAIASVSRISLFTRRRSTDTGINLEIEGGRLISRMESGCPVGTTIAVRDLFYNTPARQKFMKRDVTEAGHVYEAIVRAALANPSVSIRFIKDGAETLSTTGEGGLLSCLYSVYGREFSSKLIEVNGKREHVHVSGFIGKTELTRSSRAQQLFSVNGRPVRSRILTAAMEEPYQNELPSGRLPVCVLQIEMPPVQYDINVHPAKSEIKFANERLVYDAVYFAIKEALNSDTERKTISLPRNTLKNTFRSPPPLDTANTHTEINSQLSETSLITENTCKDDGSCITGKDNEPCITDKDSGQHFNLEQNAPLADSFKGDTPVESKAVFASWRYIGEALGGFLLIESENSLFLIDKHAAHERIIFENLKEMKHAPMSQVLLMPVTVVLTALECDALSGRLDFLQSVGFEVEDFGGNSVVVRCAPDVLDPADVGDSLSEIAKELLIGRKNPSLIDNLLHLIACKAAVKLGRAGHPSDMLSLAKTVMETPSLRNCPHGRPIVVRLTRSYLERQFCR